MATPAPVRAPPVAPPADRRGANLPERIHGLANLTRNLWWSWQLDARELFHRIDHWLWESTRHNAVQFLRQVAPERLERATNDPPVLERYDQVLRRFEQLTEKNGNWFASPFPEMLDRP